MTNHDGRKKGMTKRDAALPVLLDMDRASVPAKVRADGLVYLPSGAAEPTSLEDAWRHGRWAVPLRVCVIPPALLRSVNGERQGIPIPTKWGVISPGTRDRLVAATYLLQAIQTNDEGALEKYKERRSFIEAAEDADRAVSLPAGERVRLVTSLKPALVELLERRLGSDGSWYGELCMNLNRAISPGVLWCDTRRTVISHGLLCSTLQDALFVLLAQTASTPRGVGYCARCGAAFTKARGQQKYCSERCGDAGRHELWRARKKQTTLRP